MARGWCDAWRRQRPPSGPGSALVAACRSTGPTRPTGPSDELARPGAPPVDGARDMEVDDARRPADPRAGERAAADRAAPLDERAEEAGDAGEDADTDEGRGDAALPLPPLPAPEAPPAPDAPPAADAAAEEAATSLARPRAPEQGNERAPAGPATG